MHRLLETTPAAAWIGLACGLLALATLSTYVFRAVRSVARVLSKLNDLADDWRGEPARAGRPARRGVMERISDLEAGQAHVNAQMVTNGGTSLKDQMNRIESRLNKHIAETTGKESHAPSHP